MTLAAIATPRGLRQRAALTPDLTARTALYAAADLVERTERRGFLLAGWNRYLHTRMLREMKAAAIRLRERGNWAIAVSEEPDDDFASAYQRIDYRRQRAEWGVGLRGLLGMSVWGPNGFVRSTPAEVEAENRKALDMLRTRAHKAKHRTAYKGDPLTFVADRQAEADFEEEHRHDV